VARAFSDESDAVEFVGAVMDLTERKRDEMLLAGEKQLLEMIARGDPRAAILDALCRLVEELVNGSVSSILLLDSHAGRLRHGAAPSLPAPYIEAIDGIVIGPAAGSCGTAAYRGKAVIVSVISPYRTVCERVGPRRYSPRKVGSWGRSRSIIAKRIAPLRTSIMS
jgi:hypothetical protein